MPADVTLNHAVTLNGAVGGPISVFGEACGAIVQGQGLPDRHSVRMGATVLLDRAFRVDVRGGLGIVGDVPKWLAGAVSPSGSRSECDGCIRLICAFSGSARNEWRAGRDKDEINVRHDPRPCEHLEDVN
jgi:hypothetical protein